MNDHKNIMKALQPPVNGDSNLERKSLTLFKDGPARFVESFFMRAAMLAMP
jgi:hypothetical protein